MAYPIKSDCKTTFHAVHSSGIRDVKKILWVVMHDTEGGTAESVARYFSTQQSGGSAHLVVDDGSCYRCLRNDEIPWGAPGANMNGFHIEQCGYASWSAAEWKQHMEMLERAAFKAAYHCHKFNIPPRFVGAAGLKNGTKGITTHMECTKAFGGDHTDPGPGWPRAVFMKLTQKYFAELAGV